MLEHIQFNSLFLTAAAYTIGTITLSNIALAVTVLAALVSIVSGIISSYYKIKNNGK